MVCICLLFIHAYIAHEHITQYVQNRYVDAQHNNNNNNNNNDRLTAFDPGQPG